MTKEKHLFLMSSAINTKFGWFTPFARMHQVQDTAKSIVSRIPDAKIVIIESSGWQLEPEQLENLKKMCDFIIDYSSSPAMAQIQKENDNRDWDGVKNICEVTCFHHSMSDLDNLLKTKFKDVTRIHKISGRYRLNENFNKYLYEVETDKIIFAEKKKSQFTPELNLGIELQFMSRLWSWPRSRHKEVKNFYQKSLQLMSDSYKQNKYVDIEHLLYNHFKDKKNILEVPKIGIEGFLGGAGFIDVDD